MAEADGGEDGEERLFLEAGPRLRINAA
jgi:hypothetical protein